jgi:YVTN family beta-propeller protein
MKLTVLLATCLLVVTASAQWLETTIYVPDSLCGLVPPSCLLHNPTNNTVYVGGGGDCAIAIDASTNQKIARIPTGSSVSAMCHNPLNNKVYCATPGSSNVTVIDAAANEVIATVPVGDGPGALCWNPTGNKVYCANSDSDYVTVIDGVRDTVLATITVDGCPRALCYSSGNDKVYCIVDRHTVPGYDSIVTVIDCAGDTVIATIVVGRSPQVLCYNPQDNKVYCANGTYGAFDTTVSVVDCAGDTVLATIGVGMSYASALCYDPQDNKVYCAASEMTAIDGAGDTVIARIDAVGSGVLCYNPANNEVYCASGDRVTAIDCAADTIIAVVTGVTLPCAICCAPEVSTVYCAGGESSSGYWTHYVGARVAVIDGTNNQILTLIDVGDSPLAFCNSPQNDKVYCLGQLGSVTILDAATNQPLGVLRAGDSIPDIYWPLERALCANSQDNKLYCTNGGDESVTIIDCASDTVIATVPAGRSNCLLCYNPQRNKVYCACNAFFRRGYDTTMTVIDGTSNSVTATIPIGLAPRALCYNPENDEICCSYGGGVAVIGGWADSVITRVPIGPTGDLCHNHLNNKVYCSSLDSNNVVVIDGVTDSVLAVVAVGSQPGALCYNPENNKVYCTGAGLTVIDGAGDTVLTTVDVGGDILCYDSQNNSVYCANSGTGVVAVIGGAADSVVCTIGVGDGPVALCHNPLRNRVYVANRSSLNISVIRDTVGVGILSPNVSTDGRHIRPTIVRAVLRIEDRGRRTEDRAELLDAAGRKVLDLQPGSNDIRHIAPGVYFVREEGPRIQGSEGSSVRKVIVTR